MCICGCVSLSCENQRTTPLSSGQRILAPGCSHSLVRGLLLGAQSSLTPLAWSLVQDTAFTAVLTPAPDLSQPHRHNLAINRFLHLFFPPWINSEQLGGSSPQLEEHPNSNPARISSQLRIILKAAQHICMMNLSTLGEAESAIATAVVGAEHWSFRRFDPYWDCRLLENLYIP